MKNKYTPGPWSLDTKNDSRFRVISVPNELGFRTICETDILGQSNENAANARLIADAPIMLALLKRIALWEFTDRSNIKELVHYAKAIVERIEGES